MSLILEDIDNEDDISIGPSLLSSKEYSFQTSNLAMAPRKESPEEKPIPFLSSFTRVNAFGAKLTCIKTDNSTKQIFLTSSSLTSSSQKTHSWLVGCNLDNINIKKLENKDKTNFSSQKFVFENLKYQFEDFFKKKRTSKLTVLTMGGKSSGKSYTLFGIHDNGSIREHGILFRFADYLFSNQSVRGCYIILRLYIVQDENVIDVLGSPKSYWHENNIFHTELSGPLILPLNSFVVSSLEQYMRVVTACLTVIAYTMANVCDVVSGGSTVIVSNTVVSPEENKIWTVEFVEMCVPFHFSDEPKDATDPFWTQSYKVRSTETVAAYLVASSGEENTSKKQSLDDSIVSYLLSDFLQGTASGIVIGCLRANESSYPENASTLESLSRLDELFHEKHGGLDDGFIDGQEGHPEQKTHDAETAEAAYNIPVDLQKWLNDCQSEMQNFTRLIEKDSSRYASLRFPHPDEPRPFTVLENGNSSSGGRPLTAAAETSGSAASVNNEEEAAALENQPVLQTIKKRIGYYMQKRHYLSQSLSILSEIIQQSGQAHLIPHAPTSQKLFAPEGIDDASLSSSDTEEHRSFEEVNKVLETDMQSWLREKGLSPQPLTLPDGAVDTDSLPSFSSSISIQDEGGAAKRPATSQQQNSSPPYMILLSPNNLTEQYCRVDLVRGYTLLRVSRLSVLEPSRLHLRSVEEAVHMLDIDPHPNLEPEVTQPSPVGDKASVSLSTKNQRRVSIEEPAKVQIMQRPSDASSLTLGSFPKAQSSAMKKAAISPPQSRGRTPEKVEMQDDDDDDLTETLSVPAENLSRPPTSPAKVWDVRVEPVDPLRALTRRGEEHRFLSQQSALQKSGVLPSPEQSDVIAEKPKALKSDAGSKARSISAATAQRIQQHRERKVEQQSADHQAAAAERAAEDAQHTLTLHISDRENPFSSLLGELNLLAVIVQRFDRVHLHPTSWHLKGRGGGGQGAPPILKINSRCVEDVFDPASAQNQDGRLQVGIELFDGDIIQVGVFNFLEIHIPRKTEVSPPPLPQLMRFEQALIKVQDSYLKETVFFEFLKEKRIAAHLNVQRELNAITKHKEKTRLMALKTFSPTVEEVQSLFASTAPLMRFQIAQASLHATYMTLLAFRLRRPIRYRCLLYLDLGPSDPSDRDDQRACEILKKATSVEELLRILSFELDEPTLDVPDSESGHNKSSWLWPRSRFVHRLLCAADMLAVFSDPTGCDGDLGALSSLFPSSMDPLQDAAEDELVGVAFLNLDPLLHLLDVDDCVKIVNFNGDANGFVKLAVRSWIDKMEPVPHYITADVDVSLKEFCGQGRKLVSRFYFEFLSGLPTGHCSDCYVYFRFKKQFPVFLTPRYMGRCECPVLDCAVQVEEEVDEDLLRFLQTGCVEMEVFAKKKPALRQTLSTQGGGGGGGWLFHKVGEANFAYLGDVHEEDVLAATAVALKKQQELEAQQAALAVPENYRVQNEQLQKQLQAMKQELNSKKKQLKMTSKLSDSLKVGREAQEKRDAEALSAVRLQLANLSGENSTLLKKLVDKETELTALQKKASKVCCIM